MSDENTESYNHLRNRALHVIQAAEDNTGHEPSVSVFNRAIYLLKEAVRQQDSDVADDRSDAEINVGDALIEYFQRKQCDNYFEEHLVAPDGKEYFLQFGLRHGERPVEQLRDAHAKIAELETQLSLEKARNA